MAIANNIANYSLSTEGHYKTKKLGIVQFRIENYRWI